jgi:tRNA(Ile)-lysidine synthetase-like protein
VPRKTAQERAIIRAWRELSGGSAVSDASRTTLLACSAGVDSSALCLALASHVRQPKAGPPRFILAHIQHDLRTPALATADALRAEELARTLNLPFVLRHVHVHHKPGNAEALARSARYAALVALAREHHCPSIATAHQGDDALETFLMRALRGAGPRGLAGLLPARRLQGITIIRPMLTLSREDSLAICAAHRWSPALDHTNTLTGTPADAHAPLRSRVRALLVPTLKSLFPHAIASTARLSAVQLAISRSLHARARRLARKVLHVAAQHTDAHTRAHTHAHTLPDASRSLTFPKSLLQTKDDALLHDTLRLLVAHLTNAKGLDALSTRSTSRVLARIRSASPHAATMRLGPITLHITRSTLTLTS